MCGPVVAFPDSRPDAFGVPRRVIPMPHVLIVDDDVNQSAALAALLRHKGHEAEQAASAGQALSCLRHREPDLVLLDLTMPRVDGLDLLDALTDDSRFDGLRIAVY